MVLLHIQNHPSHDKCYHLRRSSNPSQVSQSLAQFRETVASAMSSEAVMLQNEELLALGMKPNENTAVEGHKRPDDLIVIYPKGGFVAARTTSFVERLPSGDIIKTPWAGDVREEDCRNEIAIEAQIYQRLGEHPRLVELKGWDPEACTLTLKYMPNGTLEEYIKSYHGQISPAERLRWTAQAAEGLQFLHSAGVIHCDVGPHNLLLDADLSLKIADFSGSSLDGSRAMVCPGIRYTLPDPNWKPGKPPDNRGGFVWSWLDYLLHFYGQSAIRRAAGRRG